MTSSSIGKHAGSGPASDQPAVLEPAFGERARTLMYVGRIGSLSTLSRRQSGFPFGSLMPYGLDDHGRPIFLISTMANAHAELAGRPPRQLAGHPGGHRRRTARSIEGHTITKCSTGTGHRGGRGTQALPSASRQ